MTRAALLGLVLVLAVVLAAAGIRLGVGVDWLRPVHRIAATLEVGVVAWLGWMTWRERGTRPALFRAALVALGLTVLLSAVGIAGGQNPPPALVAVNLLGGLALAAVFAWTWGAARGKPASRLAVATGALLAVQLSLGAWLSIVDRTGAVLPLHGILATALAAFLCWIGLARVRGRAGKALFAMALAAPIAGFTALDYAHSAGAALAHAASAALLLASTAYALGRGA